MLCVHMTYYENVWDHLSWKFIHIRELVLYIVINTKLSLGKYKFICFISGLGGGGVGGGNTMLAYFLRMVILYDVIFQIYFKTILCFV